MRVKSVELENIRSHVKSKIQFGSGFNCLVGGVGCGKSSVLYAIDFALFSDPIGRSFGYLLREGEDACKVTLQFVHAGKTYTVTRALKRRYKSISQDMEQLKLYEDSKLVASVKSGAVAEQLKAITGLDKDIFREIVWVRQEQLKELLNMRPRERQKRLDELFGLSDYEDAWSNMLGVQKEYEGEKKVYERDLDILGMDKLQAEYHKSVEELSLIEGELEDLKKKLAEAETALNEATYKLQSLEELKKQTEELMRKETELQTRITNIDDICGKLANEIERKNTFISNITEQLKTLETQEMSHREALQKMELNHEQTTDELRKYLLTLEEQMRSIGGEQGAVKKEMSNNQRRISSLTAESKCPLCLQSLNEDYKTSLMERLTRENSEREKRITELQTNLDELENLRNVVSQVALSLQTLTPKITDLQIRIDEEQQSSDKLTMEFEEKQQQEKAFREQLNVVRAEIGKFDLTQLELTRKLRDETFIQFSELKNNLQLKETRKRDIATRIEEVKQRLDNAEQKMKRMEKIGKLLEIISGIRGAYRSIQPRLRSEFVAYLQRMVQQVLDDLVGAAGPTLLTKIDETYTPVVQSEEGYERDTNYISGGERTLLAFAYRLGLGQLIMQSRTGHGLYILFLDEPTESLGREDGSIDRLAEAISRLKAIEQIIAVTHSEAFAEKAEHVIRVEKENNASRVSIEE
ncbi:MAG: AAA family ATPase [Candidatus Bathyarchaeia archaeon]